MTSLLKRSAALLLASLPLLVQAQAGGKADAPGNYTHAIPLGVSGKNAVVQLRLPSAAYLNARSADLDDLRVFDARGQPMPHALVMPAARAQVTRRDLAAAIFPVYGSSPAAAGSTDVEIKTSADGSVTAISTRHQASTGSTAAPLSSLVLDLGSHAAKETVDALVFTLPPAMSNYQAQVEMEVSDDLRTWEPVGSATLSWLANSEQQTLTANRMEFSPQRFRYARLSWREGTPVKFAAITAQAPTSTALVQALATITLQPAPGRAPTDLLYQSAAAIPVERLHLNVGTGNVVMPAMLGQYIERRRTKTRNAPGWEFNPQLQATFFQIAQNGKQRRSGPVITGGVHASHWVLRTESAPPVQPTLTLQWTPANLVFMAGGTAPYTLYVGNARAQSARRAISDVAPGFTEQELSALELATAGAVRVNSAKAAADAEQEQAGMSARNRTFLLWGVLLLGVAVLGAMVWKLTRQMKDPA